MHYRSKSMQENKICVKLVEWTQSMGASTFTAK